MYNYKRASKKLLAVNQSYQGETIEAKVRRITTNKEPIKDGAPLVFTERKDGVKESTNIRTDKWEIACEAMDKVSQVHEGRRKQKQLSEEEKKQAKEGMEKEKKDGGTESTQATS